MGEYFIYGCILAILVLIQKNIVELMNYYNILKEKYRFQSKNMLKLSNKINNIG